MPPKKGNKKGKKGDDADLWPDTTTSTASTSAINALDDQDERPAPSKSTFGFAGLSIEDTGEDQDFGGLMSTLKSASKKKDSKKEKKKKKNWDEDEDTPPPPVPSTDAATDEGVDGEVGAPQVETSVPKPVVQMTAEELAEDEWGPIKEKQPKGKKGKGKAPAKDVDGVKEEEEAAKPITAVPPAEEEAKDEDEAEDGAEPKMLSKKEKERLKKEREKAKKKEQAAKKKAEAGGEDAQPSEVTPTPAPATQAPPAGEDDEDDDGDAAAGGGKDKKKKKKKKTAEDKKAAEAAAPKKKPAAGIAALKAAMEAQRLAAEEEQRRQEEERRRLEEEERIREEEERKREEEKKRKKEKEKAKKEVARKEGRLLTDKQKREKAAAELRRKALLEASGVVVAGLQQSSGPAPKRAVFDRKKKKGPQEQATATTTGSEPATPQTASTDLPEPQPVVEAVAPAVEKEDWEDSEPESALAPAAVVEPEVKSDWDASSGDEAKTKAAPGQTAPTSKASTTKPAPAPENKATPPPPVATPSKKGVAANGKAGPTPPAVPKPAPSDAKGKKPAPAPAPKADEDEDEDSEDDEDDEEDDEEDGDGDGDEDDSEEDSEDEELTATQKEAERRKAEAADRRAKRRAEALAARSKDDLRSPICCILGHVDTGKTKLLDKIRQTNVQEGEAGGITQQIGATYFPVDAIKQKTTVMNVDGTQEYKIPGLLVIDTPGHESFTNLRSRGSSLCNIAVLVVDIMHGLEPQTLESLRLLRDRKTPFIVALNKIDRMYGWEAIPNNSFRDSLAKQKPSVVKEFEKRTQDTILAFSEQGLNSCLYYDNKNLGRNVSLVPTSAITGEGVPDMIMLLVNLTQQRLSEELMYLSELECTVLEVKVIEGLGTTIDVVLSNGILYEGDKIVVCGLNGPIVTQIRALLTPQPLRELRVKSAYVHHKEVKAALGVKISAPDLEKAIAGSRLMVVGPDDDEDDMKEEIMSDLTSLLNSIDKSGRGVCVQASTLGSLEALLDFLKSSKIPVSGINIGPVHKKDVMRSATMLEKAKELACILCFDVTVDKDAERMAEEMGIRLFKADIIYHLFDAFTAYNNEIVEAKRRDAAPQAVWPCRLKTIAAFAKRDPIILGVDILDGTLRVGTPLCVAKTDPTTGKREIIHLGKITSLEINHKTMELVKKSQAGAGVAVKIEHAVYESAKMFGRHFDEKDEIISQISRQSIDVLKETFKKDVSKEEWNLIKYLKVKLGIP